MAPKSKEDAVNEVKKKARECLAKFGSWSYSTVLALQDTFDIKDDTLLKAAGGFTGGIGGQNDVCGALVGSCIMLGAVFGRGRQDDMPKLAASIMQSGEFYKWFKKEFGSVKCRELLTEFGDGVFYDLHDPSQAEQVKKVLEKCDLLVEKVAAHAAEIIYDGTHKDAKEDKAL